MNDFFVSYQAYKGKYLTGLGEFIIYCSCGLEGIRQTILEAYNTHAKHHGIVEADYIVITSLTVLDPLSAVQLASDTPNAIKIEDNGNSAEKQ